jgi:Na+-transporting methylmalonyl-CoA/oxaloacetate decarboxylase gamma subunit
VFSCGWPFLWPLLPFCRVELYRCHFFMVLTGRSNMTRFAKGVGECAAGCGFVFAYLFMVTFMVYRMIQKKFLESFSWGRSWPPDPPSRSPASGPVCELQESSSEFSG